LDVPSKRRQSVRVGAFIEGTEGAYLAEKPYSEGSAKEPEVVGVQVGKGGGDRFIWLRAIDVSFYSLSLS